jgi:Rrf2 family protein
MHMSTKGRYGLRVMLELGVNHGRGPLSAEVISERQELSANYVRNLLKVLQRHGLVRIVRGPGGGYTLPMPPAEITLLRIVTVLEGSVCPVRCVEDAPSCPRAVRCATRGVWGRVTHAITLVLGDTTLQMLVDEEPGPCECPHESTDKESI